MRDQFNAITDEIDEAAFVDGLSTWGAILRIVLPSLLPEWRQNSSFRLVCGTSYFFARTVTETDAKTMPSWLPDRPRSQGQWWSMAGTRLSMRR